MYIPEDITGAPVRVYTEADQEGSMAWGVISQPFKVGAFKIEPFVLQIGAQQPGFSLFALFEGESAEPLAVCVTEPQAVSLAERLGACSDLAQARADLEAAQATVNAVAEVMAPLRGGPFDAEAWGEDLAAPANGDLLARMVAQMRTDLEAARASIATRQATIDEAHLVLDEAGVDREDEGGHTMPLWDRIGELVEDIAGLVDERDAARAGREPE